MWLTITKNNCTHIVPDKDIKPHGNISSQKNKEYELTFLCTCNPEYIIGNQNGIFEGVIIVHNSWGDREKINQSLKELGI